VGYPFARSINEATPGQPRHFDLSQIQHKAFTSSPLQMIGQEEHRHDGAETIEVSATSGLGVEMR
jgi:hypothetical protein